MNQLQKYTWVIETIRRAGKISHKALSENWERCKDLSDYKPLPRATFNRWREAIYQQFSIDIQCQKSERIVLRANKNHKYYLQSLPLHHSQRMIEDCGEYADFELKLAPTYDFVMKLLQVGSMIEVMEPLHLRKTMKGWIKDMYELYEND